MTRHEMDLAERWCIWNRWEWPADVPKPDDPVERYLAALDGMRKAVEQIGIKKCLEFWNSDEFAARPVGRPAYQSFDVATRSATSKG
jgi:hypothetical protein